MAALNAKIAVICIPDMKIPSKEYLDKTLFTGRSLYDVLTYLQTNSSDNLTKKDEQMKIIEIINRDTLLIQQLLEVWESSVRATHLFLSDNEINNIKEYVPQALKEVGHLLIIENDKKIPVGFMGIDNQHLEMLFISNEERKKGLGKMLLKYGIENFEINDLAVNEQNPLAKGFYEHMGFIVYKQTKTDEQGNPYPLLYMKRK